MDLPTARARAADFLARAHPTGANVGLDERVRPLERSWCYVFYWNTLEYFRTGHPLDGMAGNGPVVVPRDGSRPFLLPTYAPETELLDRYERDHGVAEEPPAGTS